MSADSYSRLPAGCDEEHWFIYMGNPGGQDATKKQMIDCYIETLAKVLVSPDEAKQKIYSVSCEMGRSLGFGCNIDKETAYKMEKLAGVLLVVPDNNYGAESIENGDCPN